MSTLNLAEVLQRVIESEKSMDRYYAHLQHCLQNFRSQAVAHILKVQEDKILGILNNIHLKDHENTKFIKNPLGNLDGYLLPFAITKEALPGEVLDMALEYEERLEKYYAHLFNTVSSIKSKEFFEMLVKLKVSQIQQIKSIIDTYDLAV